MPHSKSDTGRSAQSTAGGKRRDPRMPTRICGGLLALLLTVGVLPVAGQMAAPTDGKFLGNILKHNTTTDPDYLTYWNQVTPENSGKWGEVEKTRDVMDWTQLDFIYQYTRTHGIPFKQHTFVWGQQTPDWILALPLAEQREEVEEWIAAFAARYPDTEYIDVVNEPLHAPAAYREALGGAGETGWDWVIWAFETTRKYFPDAKLLINDYSIISSDGGTSNYLNLINLLQDRGLLDGIGEQAHFYESTSIATLQNNLDRLAATGLPIYISELDIHLGDDTEHLNRYQELFPIFWTHPGVRGITFWGYKQGTMWRDRGYLLRTDGSERPALTWLKEYIAANPQPFGASVTSPGNGEGFSDIAPISASATVAYGTAPFNVTFQQKLDHETEFTTISSDNTAPYTAELGDLAVGTYQIRVIVTDANSATATSAANTFNVFPAEGGTWLGTSGNWDDPAIWSGGIIANGADSTANFTGVDIETDQTISLNGNRTIGNIAFTDATTSSHDLTLSGADTLTLDVSGGSPIINISQTDRRLTISSVIAGNAGIQKAGPGTLTLSGNNSYTGTTTISDGTLRLEGDAFSATARNYSISPGAVLDKAGSNQIPSGTTTISGSGTLRGGFTNGIGSGRSLNLSLGAGGLIDVPSGSTIFNGGWQAINWTNNGARLNLDGSLSLHDGLAVTADALTGAGAVVSNNSGSGVNFTLGVNNGSGTFDGDITATGTRVISLVKDGTGTQTFAGSTTYRGSTTVNAGTLQFAKTSALYAGVTADWVKTKITVNNGGTIAFNVGGTDEFTAGDVTTLLTGLGGSVTNNGLRGGSSIAFDTTNASGGTFALADPIANSSGTGGGAVGLTKLGEHRLILSNANTYTGATHVDAGTLVIAGASLSTTAINVSASGSLGLAVESPVTASAATVSLGGSILVTGTPTLASYTLLIASSITGTPALAAPISGYSLVIEGENTLKLNYTGTAYDVWVASNATTGGPTDDFDGDGVANAIEFILGGSKDTLDLDKLPTLATPGTEMTFTFVRDRGSIDPSVNVMIDVSTDLTTWPDPFTVGADTASSSAGVTVTNNGDGSDTITLTTPQSTDTQIFARLKVVIQE